jgi:hypothetical protein
MESERMTPLLNQAPLNRSQTHRTADGEPIKIGAEVAFRIGEQNAATGLWRIRRCRVVEFVGGTRVRLEAIPSSAVGPTRRPPSPRPTAWIEPT